MSRFAASLMVLVALVVGLAPLSADAHSGKQSYLYTSVFDDAIEGRLEMPAIDLANALSLEWPTGGSELRAAVDEATASIIAYVEDNMTLSGPSGLWTLELDDRAAILPTENGPYVVLGFDVVDQFKEAPTSMTAELSVIVESDPDKDSLWLIEDNWATAEFDNGSNPTVGFSTGRTVQTVDLEGASTLESMSAIRGLGTDAVRTGIDLMLIVAAVVVPAILVPATRRRVEPIAVVARRLGSALVALVVGHSITLWLVGLGALSVSNRTSGLLVAAALVGVAVVGAIAWWKPPLWRIVPPVALVAGLAQGLGVGAAFVRFDLDRRQPVASLLAFNVGVEVTVVLVALFVAIPLTLVRRTRIAPVAALGMAAVLAAYGLAWLGERIADSDWPIEEVANPLRVWPRNFVFVVLAGLAAWGIRYVEASAGRLREVEQPQSSPQDTPIEPQPESANA